LISPANSCRLHCCTALAISLRLSGPGSTLGRFQPSAMRTGLVAVEGVETILERSTPPGLPGALIRCRPEFFLFNTFLVRCRLRDASSHRASLLHERTTVEETHGQEYDLEIETCPIALPDSRLLPPHYRQSLTWLPRIPITCLHRQTPRNSRSLKDMDTVLRRDLGNGR